VYIYDAIGNKLKKIATVGGTTTLRYYTGAFEYGNTRVLELIHTDEGIVNYSGSSYTYEYFLKDHLGNTRAAFTVNNNSFTLAQIANYYPFGMISKDSTLGNTSNKYLYNGKELQDESLEGGNLDWYDYGSRYLDPQIGRFHVIDRFAEKYASMTPYQYGANNPISFIDVIGDSLWVAFGENNKNRALYQNGKLYNSNGSLYSGEGVRITKNGKQRITNSYLSSVVSELGSISNVESKNGTNVIGALQGSGNNFTIAQGTSHFDPGTFDQPYLFGNQATYHMTTETGLVLQPFWESGGFSYNPIPATKEGSGGIIFWGGYSNTGFSLGHEMFHAFDGNTGHLIIDPMMDARSSINNTNIGEIRASIFENYIRSYNGYTLRESYNNGGHKLIDSKGNIIAMPPANVLK
jgi:RHS repeat-associated protein